MSEREWADPGYVDAGEIWCGGDTVNVSVGRYSSGEIQLDVSASPTPAEDAQIVCQNLTVAEATEIRDALNRALNLDGAKQ